jgi:capsular polysaccharide biosynthesis protein
MNSTHNAYIFIKPNNDNLTKSIFITDGAYNYLPIAFIDRNNFSKKPDFSSFTPETIDGICLLFMIDFVNNFHHFMIEMLYILKLYRAGYKIVIHENYPQYALDFIYKMSNFDTSKYLVVLKDNQLYKFNNLLTSRPRPVKARLSYMYTFLSRINLKYSGELYSRVLIVRDNNKRVCENLEEMVKWAKENGFYLYSPENSNLDTQISIMRNAKIVIAELGAGCNNLFFTQSSCKFIILSWLDGWATKYASYGEYLGYRVNIFKCNFINGDEHRCRWNIDMPTFIEYFFSLLN